jgi:hypothetical protein
MRKKIDDRIVELKRELDACSDVLKEELNDFQTKYTM